MEEWKEKVRDMKFNFYLCLYTIIFFTLLMHTVNTEKAQGTENESVFANGRLPKGVVPKEYTVDIILDAEKNKFYGNVLIKAEVIEKTKNVALHAEEMTILEFNVKKIGKSDGEALPGSIAHKENILCFTLETELDKNEHVQVSVKYEAEVSKDMAGFYISEDRSGEEIKYIYSTQFEATSARKAFPCWDEPEYKSVFNISITAPERMTVLSNSKEKNMEKAEGLEEYGIDTSKKYKKVLFKPTLYMSTYLVAWVIGELEYVADENIRVFSPKGQKEYGKFSLGVAKHCLSFFESYFDVPYQMEKLDMVAIPDFSAGAMENWGLVTYRSSSLHFIEESGTEKQKLLIAETVCHELAHQWFGNLVTMQWWNDLWLNEGFATWAGTLATAEIADKIKIKYDPWENFLDEDISRGMKMDGKISTHPINVPVTSAGEISSIFDAISYSKGASMIHMLANYVGHEFFMNGLRRYIKKHQYKNTETFDLWKAIDENGEKNVSTSMDRWINTAGMPHITVSASQDKIVLMQRRYLPAHSEEENKEDDLWNIFLTKKSFAKNNQGEVESIMFDKKKMLISAEELPFVLNAEAAGFYRIHYAKQVMDTYIKPLLKSDSLSSFDRFGIFRDAMALVNDGHENVDYGLSLLEYVSKTERYTTMMPIVEFISLLLRISRGNKKVTNVLNEKLVDLLSVHLEETDKYTKISEDPEKSKMQALAVSILGRIESTEVSDYALYLLKTSNLESIHKEYRMGMYIALSMFGGKKGYEYLLEIIKSNCAEPEKLRAITAISYSKECVDDAFEMFSTENEYVKKQDKLRMVLGLADQTETQRTFDLFLQNFNRIRGIFRGTPDHVSRFVEVFLMMQTQREAIEKAEEFFLQKENMSDAWVAGVKKGLDNAKVAYHFKEKNMQLLQEWCKA